ncbi:MAG: hypothetical protein FGM48_00275 [Candidatus Nanopelagicaceae bacterium]|jgi:hypothetical protein|nr:hypothetical protein [Candidatus Nanopelagicaceae bacterium]
MTVKFTIISGKPSKEELAILTQVLNQHKRVEKDPVVKRSTWAQPIMRAPMPQAIKFGAGRNI